jgi:SulP family sulfate permease
MHRMAGVVDISSSHKIIDEDEDDFSRERTAYSGLPDKPDDVEIFRINGPFFFGAAMRIGDVLGELRKPPKAFILRMGNVPLIDASGAAALDKFINDAARNGTRTILSNVQGNVRKVLDDLGLSSKPSVTIVKNLEKALAAARA